MKRMSTRPLIAALAAAGIVLAACGNDEPAAPSSTAAASSQEQTSAAPTSESASSAEGSTDASAPATDGTDSSATDATDGTDSSATDGTDSSATDGSATEGSATEGSATEGADSTATESASTDSSGTESASETGAATEDGAAFAAKLAEGMMSVKTMKSTMESKSPMMTMTGTSEQEVSGGKLVSSSTKAETTAGGQKIPIEMLMADGKTYLGGSMVQMIPGASGKKWILLDPNSKNPQIAQMAKQIQSQMGMTGPQAFVTMAKAITKVEEAGKEDVGGMATTKYNVEIDGAKLVDILPADQKDTAEAMSKMGKIPSVYWLDDKNRMVKFTQTMDVQGQKVETSATVTAFDEPITVKAPDAGEVYSG